MTTSEILNRAADLIQERGWTKVQGWEGDGTRPVCLEGALLAATGKHRLEMYADCAAYWAVAEYLGRDPLPRIAPVKDALWSWNDAPGRTAAEVIEVLRACAVIEASREREAAEAVS